MRRTHQHDVGFRHGPSQGPATNDPFFDLLYVNNDAHNETPNPLFTTTGLSNLFNTKTQKHHDVAVYAEDTLTTSFTAAADAVSKKDDKSMPFDVNTFAWNSTLATFMVELTSTAPSPETISAPSTTTTMQAIHENATGQDAMLDSPLGLVDDTPLSQYLASPLFSDTTSVVDYSNSATPYERPANFFPPLESIAPAALSHRNSFESASSSSPPLVPAKKMEKIALDAPIQQRNYAVPSTTSRKRKTIAVERAIAKRAREEGFADVEAVVASVDEDQVPDDLVAAVERKRMQNTLSARRARQRKAEHVTQLESENAKLRKENEDLRRRLATYE